MAGELVDEREELERNEQQELQRELRRALERARRAAWCRYGYSRPLPMNQPLRLWLDEHWPTARSSDVSSSLRLLRRLRVGVRLRND
jgi:hypothetical protein